MRPDLDLRGYLDTRGAALTLSLSALAILVIAALGGLLQPLLVETGTSELTLTLVAVTLPLMLVLPVIAVVVTAGDWSDRSIQMTLLQRPGRLGVLASKVLTALGLSVAALAVAGGLSVLTTWIGGDLLGEGALLTMEGSSVAMVLAQMGAIVLFAVAMGVLTQSTVLGLLAAIGVPVLVTTASGIALALDSSALTTAVRTVDLQSGAMALASGGGEALDVVPVLLLVVLPLALGTVRWLRREVA